MSVPKIIIAIDGYASTGKSSFAKMIAAKYGFLYLDSGAIYRAVTLFALERGFISDNGEIDQNSLKEALCELKVTFRREASTQKSETYIGERSVEKEIRQLEVSNYVSPIAVIPFVRDFVDNLLHKFGEDGAIVMDGRDIGTVVFPNAQLKIFMTADAEIRARRREKELLAKGEDVKFEDILKNVLERDYIDSHRETAPLKKADDAILLDNSYMTMEQQMEWFDAIIRERFGYES